MWLGFSLFDIINEILNGIIKLSYNKYLNLFRTKLYKVFIFNYKCNPPNLIVRQCTQIMVYYKSFGNGLLTVI